MEPDPDDEPSSRHGDYPEWLNENFDLTPPTNPNELLDVAEAELGDLSESWVGGRPAPRALCPAQVTFTCSTSATTSTSRPIAKGCTE